MVRVPALSHRTCALDEPEARMVAMTGEPEWARGVKYQSATMGMDGLRPVQSMAPKDEASTLAPSVPCTAAAAVAVGPLPAMDHGDDTDTGASAVWSSKSRLCRSATS